MSGQKSFHRDTWAEINLDSVKYNVQETIKRLREGTSLFAVVKANAYGHGAKQVADTAVEAGASGLAVAFLDEALSLRNQGIQSPILVLGASRPEDAPVAVKHSISLTVFDLGWLKKAQTSLSSGDSLNVHVKLDTGMGRLGIKTKKDLAEMVDFLTQSDVMNFEGIFTHFATADELDDTYFNQQFERFNEIIQSLEVKPPFIHCANSATTLRFTQAHMNGVRLGISMYGLSPSNDIKPVLPFKLKPAFSLHTKIVQIKKMDGGEKVSYGATYEAAKDDWIATLPIGYADGWIRKLQGQEVLVNGKRFPIVGRICMDQCMIRLPEEHPVGTTVTLIGRQGEEEITMDEIAAKLETINYEVPCIITARVPRVYEKSGKICEIVNPLLV